MPTFTEEAFVRTIKSMIDEVILPAVRQYARQEADARADEIVKRFKSGRYFFTDGSGDTCEFREDN